MYKRGNAHGRLLPVREGSGAGKRIRESFMMSMAFELDYEARRDGNKWKGKEWHPEQREWHEFRERDTHHVCM